MAAAIGAGLPVNEPTGSMIVDIGGGTTEVAVTSLGGIVISRSIRIGGDEMDSDIVQYARREFNLLMGERTAEDIKIAIGSAYPLDEEVSTYFRGRDLLTGLPRSIEVTSAQIREAIEPSIASIVEAIKQTIEETPPELIADVMDQGIYLAGGGALLRGLDTRVAEATQMAVHVAEDPLTCVVRGCGMIVEDLQGLGPQVGPPAIEAHVSALATRLLEGLGELGATVVTPLDPARRGPLVCVRSTDVDALVGELAAVRIVTSSRDDNLRIALHLYNSEGDVDTVLDALRKHRHLLA